MRREKKRGLHTNKTLKWCPNCISYCDQCKGPCKFSSDNPKIRSTIDPNHISVNLNKIKKTYRLGVGNMKSCKKFHYYMAKYHRSKRMNHYDYALYRDYKNSPIKDLKDQIECYELELFADYLKKS